MSDHRGPDPHTLVGPYVLDALPDDERDLFEEHLDRCPDCRAEASELLAAAAHLGQAVAVVPPDELRRKVLADVAVTRQVPPRAAGRAAGRRRAWPVLVAAAAVVAVLAAVAGVALRADQRADRAEQLAAILTAPDAHSVDVSGEGGTMRLVTSTAHDSAVIVADGMAAPPEGKTYALWYDRDGTMVPIGLFEPDADGTVRQRVEGVPTDIVGVTVEPDGGSDTPTFPVVAQGDVRDA